MLPLSDVRFALMGCPEHNCRPYQREVGRLYKMMIKTAFQQVDPVTSRREPSNRNHERSWHGAIAADLSRQRVAVKAGHLHVEYSRYRLPSAIGRKRGDTIVGCLDLVSPRHEIVHVGSSKFCIGICMNSRSTSSADIPPPFVHVLQKSRILMADPSGRDANLVR